MELTKSVPTSSRDPEAQQLFDANLTVSKAYSLFSLVVYGKDQKTEKNRDEAARWKLFYSAAPYTSSEKTKLVILETDKQESSDYLIRLAKITQQTMTNAIPGTVIKNTCAIKYSQSATYTHPMTLRCIWA